MKPIVWLHGEIKTPPFSTKARQEVGLLLRLVQDGDSIGMPRSRPMPSIGDHCHELRVRDEHENWRVFYRVDKRAVLVIAVEAKKTPKTPKRTIEICRERLRRYDKATAEGSRPKGDGDRYGDA